MGKKEDKKKEKSKGVAYVTNGDSKPSGLPDPEMTVPNDDVSSEGLSHKKARRCGRYRCPIIFVGLVIGLAGVACIVYFSVNILLDDDDKKPVNASSTGEFGRGGDANVPAQVNGQGLGDSATEPTTTRGRVDLSDINAGSLVRGAPNSLMRGMPRRPEETTTTTTTEAPRPPPDLMRRGAPNLRRMLPPQTQPEARDTDGTADGEASAVENKLAENHNNSSSGDGQSAPQSGAVDAAEPVDGTSSNGDSGTQTGGAGDGCEGAATGQGGAAGCQGGAEDGLPSEAGDDGAEP